jgi:hypothetical protein
MILTLSWRIPTARSECSTRISLSNLGRQGENTVHKEDVLASARRLVPPSPRAAQALAAVVDVCAAELSAAMARRPDLAGLIGPGNRALMDTNHINHFNYLASLAALYDPVSFVEIVLWVFRTYRARGFAVGYWHAMLPESKAVVLRHLDAGTAAEITPIHDWLLVHVPDFTVLSDNEPTIFETMSPLGGGRGH